MRHLTKTEVIVVEGKAADAFQDEVNKALSDLAEEEIEADLQIDTNPLVAVITYTRHLRIAEDIVDDYNLKGVYAKCNDCEQFQPEEDDRKKYGYCRAHSRRTYKGKNACRLYYEMKERWGE